MHGTTCKRGHPKTDRTRHNQCRLCMNLKAEEWRVNHPERHRAIVQADAWQRYGIVNFTPLDYDRLYQVQQGRCAICKKHQSEFKRRLSVDHDHKTGRVRGLLCGYCNTYLSVLENQEFKMAAQKYLEAES